MRNLITFTTKCEKLKICEKGEYSDLPPVSSRTVVAPISAVTIENEHLTKVCDEKMFDEEYYFVNVGNHTYEVEKDVYENIFQKLCEWWARQ